MHKKPNKPGHLPWHSAFVQAMQQELFHYLDVLEFSVEHSLTSEPLQIDLIIIKKLKDVEIDNDIARIFRAHNIVEYKSPEDYLAIEDFWKVTAYAHLYAAISPDVDLSDVTLTFIEARHPRKLLRYLAAVRKYAIEKTAPGMYSITGDYIPIQLIETKKLAEKEHRFLNSLKSSLRLDSMNDILGILKGSGREQYMSAYLDVLMRANPRTYMEVNNMAKTYPTLDELFIQSGFTQRMEERFRMQGSENTKEQIAQNLLSRGMPITEIAEIAELPVEKVREIASPCALRERPEGAEELAPVIK
jgi:hypothetical protein